MQNHAVYFTHRQTGQYERQCLGAETRQGGLRNAEELALLVVSCRAVEVLQENIQVAHYGSHLGRRQQGSGEGI